MGGNAFTHKQTRRYDKDEYESLEIEVINLLEDNIIRNHTYMSDWPPYYAKALDYYTTKETFGDMDIVVRSDWLEDDWLDKLFETFDLTEDIYIRNGGVHSFVYKEFQIDLIMMPQKHFVSALNYYAWNDLGNLIGRMSHKLGLKFGHKGLEVIVRDGDQQLGTIMVTTNIKEILEILNLDYDEWAIGFPTIESMFEWLSNSKYFNKDIYALENRNHAARTRDRKRANYMAFTEWTAGKKFVYNYPYDEVTSRDGYNVREPFFTDLICANFIHVKGEYDVIIKEHKNRKVFKTLYNGEIVSESLGYQNQKLGEFMSWMNNSFPLKEIAKTDVVHSITPQMVEMVLTYANEHFCAEKRK